MRLDHLPSSSADDFAGFRREVREFVAANVGAGLRRRILLGKPATQDETMAWHRALHRRGWVAPAWPKEFGGPGWSLAQRWTFDEELALAGAPPLSAPGLTTVGPGLISSGSREQQARYLARILDASEIWPGLFRARGRIRSRRAVVPRRSHARRVPCQRHQDVDDPRTLG